MFVQIALGTGLMMVNIVIAGISYWYMEYLLVRAHPWLIREPHGPKLMLTLCVAALWSLGLITVGVWVWAFAFWLMGLFITLEASVYFSLVAYTTLGFGDILLPTKWRLLAGMAAANGLMNVGVLTAAVIEALRHVRGTQIEVRNRPR